MAIRFSNVVLSAKGKTKEFLVYGKPTERKDLESIYLQFCKETDIMLFVEFIDNF